MKIEKKQIENKKKLIFFTYLFSIFMLKDKKSKIFKNANLFSTFKNKKQIFLNVEKKLHKRNLELWWTLIPAIILFIIGAPSLSVLYSISELIAPELTVKAIGNQWFWTYEYSLYFGGNTPELWINYEKEKEKLLEINKKYTIEREWKHKRYFVDRAIENYGTKTLTYNYRTNRKVFVRINTAVDFWIYSDFNMGIDENGKLKKFTLTRESMRRKQRILIRRVNDLLQTILNQKLIIKNMEFLKPLLPQKLIYESHMILEDELKKGELRLLEVDYWLILPINIEMRFLVSSADVIHSFAVPALGIKVDGIPGRTNEVPVFIKRKGIFYGQCSELCGVNHAFMPIVVQAVNKNAFTDIMLTILGWDLKKIIKN